VLVSGDFTPLGGMDHANHGLASYLARRPDTEVHLVTHRAWPDLQALPDLTVHPVARPLGKHMLGWPLLDLAGRRLAKRLGPGTHVVVNGGNCRWNDINWVHYVHAAWNPRPLGGFVRRTKAIAAARLDRSFERANLLRARIVIANSERTRADLIEHVGVRPDRVHTVYYGVDPDQFRPATTAERAEIRHRLGWDDRPTVAFVGGLGDLRKGFDTLFEAWRRLVARGWDARLAVIGAGSTLAYWSDQARTHGLDRSIAFLGFRSDVPELLRVCDALVSPTRYEAYGLNVHEALCSGLPAFVSRSAGVAERYPEELHSYLIPDPEDAADLAARLTCWRERGQADASALRALSDRLRTLTWDHMAERFVGVVEMSG
jgi:glycosyltransferase involved in cell wall biosynthesis